MTSASTNSDADHLEWLADHVDEPDREQQINETKKAVALADQLAAGLSRAPEAAPKPLKIFGRHVVLVPLHVRPHGAGDMVCDRRLTGTPALRSRTPTPSRTRSQVRRLFSTCKDFAPVRM
jgi:hypothetical protein